MRCYVLVIYAVCIILVSQCCFSNAHDAENTAMVKIDDQQYSTLKRPKKDSAIVNRVLEANTQLKNVEGMLHLFSNVGVFIRVAQHGLRLYPILQAELTSFFISVIELNDDAGLMVGRFAAVSESVLSHFEYAFWYLYHEDKDEAMREFEKISNSSAKMIEQASNMRDRVVRKRDEAVQYTHQVAEERLEVLTRKKELEEERRKFEEEVKKAEVLMKEAEAEEKRYYKLYKETIDEEYDAYGDIFSASLFNGVLKVGATLFTGGASSILDKEPIDVSAMEGFADSLAERAMLYLKKMETYVEQKHKALESYAANMFLTSTKADDIEIADETYDALIGTQESLQLIAFIMEDVVFFWNSTHAYLQFLLVDNPDNFNSLVSQIREMDVGKLWKKEPFKEQVVVFYSHWVALINVCKQSLAKFVETRNKMRVHMMMDEAGILAEYEHLRKNPRLIEHQKN